MKRAERAQRRLSKPRSLKYSTSSQLDLSSISLEGSSPATSAGADYFGPDAVSKVQGSRQSKSKSRSKIRAYLYGSPSKSLADTNSDEDTSSPSRSVPDAAVKAKYRPSRSASVFTQRSSARDSTTLLANFHGNKADGDENDELEDPETVAKQIKERAQQDSLAANNHKHLQDDEEAGACDYLRRKSLFTPGLAKRDTSDILRKPTAQSPSNPQSPLSEADLNYYYDQSHSADSPLSCLAALKLPVDGRGTPSSLNVPSLGGLKHGTLHVTNGLGSPIPLSPRPASICRSPTISHIDRDEFHTASEGSICDRESSRSPVPISLSESMSPSRPSNSHDADMTEPDIDLPIRDTKLNKKSALSSTLALEYITELGDTPFSHSEPCSRSTSPTLETSSGADFPPVTSDLPMIETFRTQICTVSSFQGSTTGSHGPAVVTYSSGPLNTSYSTTETTTSIVTRDSGYHSSESLNKSITTGSNPIYRQCVAGGYSMDQPVEHANDLESGSIAVTNLASSKAGMAGPPADITRVRGRKLQKERPKMKSSSSHSVIDSTLHTSLADTTIPRVPSAMAVRHAQRLVDFPLLEHTYPSLDHVNPGKSPHLTHARPAIITFPEPSGPIDEATAFFPQSGVNEDSSRPQLVATRRWSSFVLSARGSDQKRLVKKTEETRRREEKTRSKLLEEERKQKEYDDYGEVKSPDWRSRATSRVRGKSVDRRSVQNDQAGTIADLGTVAHSIGGSPYDIATSINPRAVSSRPGCHPHQLGAVRPRPHSFVGMDDSTASEFAHARSRLRQRPIRERPKTICAETLIFDEYRSSATGTKTSDDTVALQASDQLRGVEDCQISVPTFWRKPVPAYAASAAHGRSSGPKPCRPDTTQSRYTESMENRPRNQAADDRPKSGCNETTVNWQDHQSAWRQRRKSAGNALRNTQLASHVHSGTIANTKQEAVAASLGERQGPMAPRKAAMSPKIASLAGRYDGGFDFGFERGCGVGGSAGTRNLGNSAARKSADVSKGYGLDLSDLPIFVAHAPR